MYQDKIIELKTQLEQLKAGQLSDITSAERKKFNDLHQEIINKQEEYNSLKENHEIYSERSENEIKYLQHELDRAVSLVSRQENSIIELRMRKTEDNMNISNLNDLLSSKENELSRITMLYEKLQRENDEFNGRCEYTENNYMQIKEENKQLKIKILELKEKEGALKDERKQIAKMKIELLNQRNAEVSKLTDALDAVIYNKT